MHGSVTIRTISQTMSLLLLLLLLLIFTVIAIADDSAFLLQFKNTAAGPASSSLLATWNNSTHPCQWHGVVRCTPDQRVSELDLRYMKLTGTIAANTLSQLDQLLVLNLAQNQLTGPIPSDLSNLQLLQKLYLTKNQLSGPLPSSLGRIQSLRVIDLSYNHLNGPIPPSIAQLQKLHHLHLQNNQFTGPIPPFNQAELIRFNLSFNQLSGPIPDSMSKWSLTCFIGNPQLCGSPLDACQLPSVKRDANRKDTGKKVAIALGLALTMGFIILLVLTYKKLKHSTKALGPEEPAEEKNVDSKVIEEDIKSSIKIDNLNEVKNVDQQAAMQAEVEKGYLVFFEEANRKYELDDLLRASAEVLGRGIFGTAYKASLQGGIAVVVKRLRNLNILSKEEFDKQMQSVGTLNHPNILPLRAYYYSKDEKLLAYDYQPYGSLFSLLHDGKQGSERKPLDWSSRIKIARGVANGIAYLQKQFTDKFHGNIKSSNIILDSNMEACISDFGLAPLVSNNSVAESYMAGYRAPECRQSKKIAQSADIYSYGVVLLELLTGKLPFQSFAGGYGVDLPTWVNSVVREEWTTEVFDRSPPSLGRAIEDELVVLLRIAMACVSSSPEQRPSMTQIVEIMDVQIKKMEEGTFFDSSDSFSHQSEGRYEDVF